MSGIPFGTIVSWSHDPILPPGQSILTLSVPQMSVPNTYSLLAVAVGEDAVGQVPFTLKVSRLNNRIFLPVVLMEH